MGGDGTRDTDATAGTGDTDEAGARGGSPDVQPVAGKPGTESEPAQPRDPPGRTAEATGSGSSAVAAVLLNLTGVGLGYVYLRCWLRATACAVIVVLMAVVAFANDAASDPWLWRGLAAAWVVATAVDAWWVAARERPPPRTRSEWWRPVAAGVLAVAVVVAAHSGYAQAARATYAAGVEAQGRAACDEANRAFALLAGPYELTLSRDVPAAEVRRAECADFLVAERAEHAGAHAEAVAAYRAFRRAHPQSSLERFAGEGTRRGLYAWAVALRNSGFLDGAITRYRELLAEPAADPGTGRVREELATTYLERADTARRSMPALSGQARVGALRVAMEDLLLVGRELPETAAAGRAPQAILDTFAQANDAVVEGRFCDALPVLDYAVTLPETAGVAAVAHTDRARSLFECGLANFHDGELEDAASRFTTLVADYPDDPGVAQARAALITSEVARSATVPLPLPAPIDAPGTEPVLVYNATSTEVRVLITGPTAHELTLPGCVGCPPVYVGGDSCPGPEGKPSATIRMRPGAYYLLQDRVDPANDAAVNEPITVERGGGTLCVTVRLGG